MDAQNLETIAVLSVELDKVQFVVMSPRDRMELVNEQETLKLMTADEWPPVSTWTMDDTVAEMAAMDSHTAARVEQDPDLLWAAVQKVVSNGTEQLTRVGIQLSCIQSVAVVTEMATLMVWDGMTSEKLGNAIHWTDGRMRGRCTANAIQWLLEESEAVRFAGHRCRFGTVDVWLLWRLTEGQEYITDPTNASYTGLLDLDELDWDRKACRSINLPDHAWPSIRTFKQQTFIEVGPLEGRSVNVVMARPSATLYGQGCYRSGQVAATLGTRTAVALASYEGAVPDRCGRWSADIWDRCSGVAGPAPVVGYLEPNPSSPSQARVVYGQLTVSTAPSVLCWMSSGVALASSTEQCMFVYKSKLPKTNDQQPIKLNGLTNCGAVGDGWYRDYLYAIPVDSIAYGPNDMVRAIAAGVVATDPMDTVYVDGAYSRNAGVMQRMADVTGADAMSNREDMAVHGAARMVVTMVYGTELPDLRGTAVCRPKSTAEQRDAWTRRWTESVFGRFECVYDVWPDFKLERSERLRRPRTAWTLLRDVARFVRTKFGLLLKSYTDDPPSVDPPSENIV